MTTSSVSPVTTELAGSETGITLVIHAGAGSRGKHSTPERIAQVELDLQRALDAGYQLLESGAPAHEAVVAAIHVMEDAPEFNAGRGAALTSDGIAQMDACLISAMLGHTDGACMICGTGSSLCYRQGESYGHIGGWGYLVDSCASGFILGKKALLAVAREQDGRGEKTLLTQLIAQQCGESMEAHFEKIYAGGRPYIASFARLVFEARRAGDRVAAQIFDECVADLNELVWTAYRRFGGGYPLVLNGGIFQHFPEYVQAVKAHAPQQVQIIDSDAPPVYGGAVEAMYDAGMTCDAAFKQRFLEGYNQA